jgi:hypothetical protein
MSLISLVLKGPTLAEANAATTPILLLPESPALPFHLFSHSIGFLGMRFMGIIIEMCDYQLSLWAPAIIDFS